MKIEAISELCSETPGSDEGFSPKVPRDESWHKETGTQHQWHIVAREKKQLISKI